MTKDIEIQRGHYIKLTYSGNGKYTATWHGWPRDDHKSVRRVIHTDYKLDDAIREAAKLFVAWLETGPLGEDGTLYCDLVAITAAGTSKPDVTAIVVDTEWKEKESQ